VVAIIGVMTGTVADLFLFLILFVPLRVFAGGFHLNSLTLCAIASSMLIVAVAMIMKYFDYSVIYSCSFICEGIIAYAVIFVLAPVDTKNKSLYQHEKEKYRAIARLIAFVELAIFILPFVNMKIRMLAYLSVMIESVYLILQKIINCVAKHTTSRLILENVQMANAKKSIMRALIKMGKLMVKIDTHTACLWTNYQPREPEAVKRLRAK
jgi:accessory gene regulator B